MAHTCVKREKSTAGSLVLPQEPSTSSMRSRALPLNAYVFAGVGANHIGGLKTKGGV